MTFPVFRHYIATPATTRVIAFLSTYVVGGLEGHYYPQLYGPNGIDVGATERVAQANSDLIKGIKAHAEIGGVSRWGIEVLQQAKQISKQAGLPLYVHLGQLWALPEVPSVSVEIDQILPQAVDLLEAGDILAHPFTRHPGGFVNQQGEVHPVIQEALQQGIRIDVGHGSHFSFQMARQVLEAGILPHTLGADMHGYNTQIPAEPGTPLDHPDEEMHPFAGQTNFSLIHAMNGLMACDLSLEQVIRMATSNAAAMVGLQDQIGTLKPGSEADVSVLRDLRGRWRLQDNEGTQVITDRLLQPAFCLRSGQRFEANAPILPVPQAA